MMKFHKYSDFNPQQQGTVKLIAVCMAVILIVFLITFYVFKNKQKKAQNVRLGQPRVGSQIHDGSQITPEVALMIDESDKRETEKAKKDITKSHVKTDRADQLTGGGWDSDGRNSTGDGPNGKNGKGDPGTDGDGTNGKNGVGTDDKGNGKGADGDGTDGKNGKGDPGYYLSKKQVENTEAEITDLVASWSKANGTSMTVTSSVELKPLKTDKQKGKGGENGGTGSSGYTDKPRPDDVLVESATSCYAYLSSYINSDYPMGLIRTEIIGCEDSRSVDLAGAILFGDAERRNDVVTVIYNMMRWQGRGYAIKAMAVDEKVNQGILTGEVDRHVFLRWVLPILANATTGWAEASARNNTEVLHDNGQTTEITGALSNKETWAVIAGKAGEAVIELSEEALGENTVTVEIEPTTIGVVFLEDVMKKTE